MNYPQAQSVYQCFLALKLGMREFEEAGDVYGDFGCGIGGPTRMIAQFSGAKIVAVNINKMHLEYLARYNDEVRLLGWKLLLFSLLSGAHFAPHHAASGRLPRDGAGERVAERRVHVRVGRVHF